MTKLTLVLFTFLLLAIVLSAHPTKYALAVKGRVYCEKSQASFETTDSEYIVGAKVSIECVNRLRRELLYRK